MSELTMANAEEIERSQTLIDTLEQSIAALKKCGALSACANLENEILKERRRMRNLSRTDSAVAAALVRRRQWEELEIQKQNRLEDDGIIAPDRHRAGLRLALCRPDT